MRKIFSVGKMSSSHGTWKDTILPEFEYSLESLNVIIEKNTVFFP